MRQRINFWWRKVTNPYFQWGHPDEWDKFEWYYQRKARRR